MSFKNISTEKIPRKLLFLLEFSGGLAMSSAGSILPDISDIFQLSRSAASWIPLSQFLGGFTGLLFLGIVLPKLKPRIALSCAAFIMTLSSLLISIIPTFSFTVIASFFFVGAPMVILFALPGVLVTHYRGENTAGDMNILYSFMSAGVVISPVITGVLLTAGYHYPTMFLIISSITFISGIISSLTPFPAVQLGRGLSFHILNELYRNQHFFFIAVLLMSLCYMGAETIPNNWIPKYLNDMFPGFADFRSRLILSLFWASITVGRYLCATLLRFWKKPEGLLAVLSLLTTACLITSPLMNSRIKTEVLFVLSGLFFSGMIPIIFSFSDAFPGDLSGIMFILIMAIGTLSASGFNKLVGIVADGAGFRIAVMLGAVPLLFLFVFVVIKKR